jgi:hypothetical protein
MKPELECFVASEAFTLKKAASSRILSPPDHVLPMPGSLAMCRAIRALSFAATLLCASFTSAAGQSSSSAKPEPKPMQEWTYTWAEVRDSVNFANEETNKFLEQELANELAAADQKPSTASEHDFFKAYAKPDLQTIEEAIHKFRGYSNLCRDALCIETDCLRTNDAHQKLLLLMGELSALEAWQAKAYQTLMEHMNQLDSEKERKKAHRDYIDAIRKFQVAMHETANAITNLTDVIGWVQEGMSSPTSLPPKLQFAIDATNQALNAISLLNTTRSQVLGIWPDAPLPDWFQTGGTVYQIVSEVKNLLDAALAASKAAHLPEDFWAEKRRYSILQLAAKILMIFSDRSIGQTQKLVDQYERLIQIEHRFNLTFRTEVDRLAALRTATSATRGKAADAARDFGLCLKSCSAGEVLRNPNPEDDPDWKKLFNTSYNSANFSETKSHYLHYLRYYQARLKLLTRQVLTAHAGVSVKSVDPQDPAAPEKCRQLVSPSPGGDDDLAAGLERPAVQFPKLTLPARFCSEQERIDYDAKTLKPALDAASKVWRAAAHYDSELSIRLDKVKNTLAVLQPDSDPNADATPSDPPKVGGLKRQREKLKQLRADFAPDLEKAKTETSTFNEISAAFLKLTPEACEDITPLNIMIPSLPEIFCSEQERAGMMAKLEDILKMVRKHKEARRNYKQGLYARHAAEKDRIIKASLEKEIADANIIDSQGDGLVSTLNELIDKAKALEIGECIDPCLVGNWELRNSPFSGIRVSFKSDGTETVDYSGSQPWVLSENPPSAWYLMGKGTAKIITPQNKTAKFVEPPKSDIKFYMHSKDMPPLPLTDRLMAVGLGGTTGDNAYVCTKDTLTYEGSIHADQRPNFKVKLTRLAQ